MPHTEEHSPEACAAKDMGFNCTSMRDQIWPYCPPGGFGATCHGDYWPQQGGNTKLAKFANFAKFWQARSRLYQNEILQENMRLTASFKLYKICILLHRCNLNILAKNRFGKSAIFVKFQQIFANVAKFAKLCLISEISAR